MLSEPFKQASPKQVQTEHDTQGGFKQESFEGMLNEQFKQERSNQVQIEPFAKGSSEREQNVPIKQVSFLFARGAVTRQSFRLISNRKRKSFDYKKASEVSRYDTGRMLTLTQAFCQRRRCKFSHR